MVGRASTPRKYSTRNSNPFLLKSGTTMEMLSWPCPRYSEDMAGCKAAFYPDGDTRRSPQDEERRYQKTLDTMACKFYDELAMWSPCEGGSVRVVCSRACTPTSITRASPWWLATNSGVGCGC